MRGGEDGEYGYRENEQKGYGSNPEPVHGPADEQTTHRTEAAKQSQG